MRELTKSIGSFSWALSLFAARQTLAFLRQPLPGPDHPAARGFTRVADRAGGELGGWLRGVYEAGDRAQRSAVDLFFSAVRLGNGDLDQLGRATQRAWRDAGRAVTEPITGDAGSGAGQNSGDDSGGGGWGPMPPLPDVPELQAQRERDCCG